MPASKTTKPEDICKVCGKLLVERVVAPVRRCVTQNYPPNLSFLFCAYLHFWFHRIYPKDFAWADIRILVQGIGSCLPLTFPPCCIVSRLRRFSQFFSPLQGTPRCVSSPRWIYTGAEQDLNVTNYGCTLAGVSATRRNHKTTQTKLLPLMSMTENSIRGESSTRWHRRPPTNRGARRGTPRG